MAWFDQKMKQEMAPKIKKLCQKYGIKGRLSVHNHSTVIFNVTEGIHDFCKDRPSYFSPNQYWLDQYEDNPILHSFLKEAFEILFEGNWDKSDIQTDYFNVGWYVNLNIGSYNKPYIYKKEI